MTISHDNRLVDPVDLSLSKFILNRGRPVTLFTGTPSEKTIALAFSGETLFDPSTLHPAAEALESGFYILSDVHDLSAPHGTPGRTWLFAGQVGDYLDIVNESLDALPEEIRSRQREGLRFIFIDRLQNKKAVRPQG